MTKTLMALEKGAAQAVTCSLKDVADHEALFNLAKDLDTQAMHNLLWDAA